MAAFAKHFSGNNFIRLGTFDRNFESIVVCLGSINFGKHVHARNDSTKDSVFTIKLIIVFEIKEKLTSSGIAACVSHRNCAGKISSCVSCLALTFNLVAGVA